MLHYFLLLYLFAFSFDGWSSHALPSIFFTYGVVDGATILFLHISPPTSFAVFHFRMLHYSTTRFASNRFRHPRDEMIACMTSGLLSNYALFALFLDHTTLR